MRKIINQFNQRDQSGLAVADYGVRLNPSEQSRRYVIRSLLQSEGLDRAAFLAQFGQEVQDQFPEITQLIELGYADWTTDRLSLNESGLAHSDVIGPWLYSDAVKQRMEQFAFT